MANNEKQVQNYHIITEALQIMTDALQPYIYTVLRKQYKDDWYSQGVYFAINPNFRQNLIQNGTDEEKQEAMDLTILCNVIESKWNLFKPSLPLSAKGWVKEIQEVRNDWAHRTPKQFTDAETKRALGTMAWFCQHIDSTENEQKLNALERKLAYGTEEGSIAQTVVKPKKVIVVRRVQTSVGELKPWREVICPHQDVAEGRYKNSEFAADLNDVVVGTATLEYRDPVEFFGRTYITEGLETLLVNVTKRLTGKDGEPVYQLQTAFGGGKTHSMLALYHLLNGKVSITANPGLKKVKEKAEVEEFPKANIAVIVGTKLAPASFKRPTDMPGIQINTVWGDIAYQLAKSAHKPELYDIIKEDDRKGVSPGAEKLRKLFDECGSCMILIDELVAYARKLDGKDDLPAGTFENFLSFVQELTEAISSSKNSVLIASLPESEIEIGGDAGQKALDSISHCFARKQSIWKPVTSTEGFEIVRRRLFLKMNEEFIKDRDKVCEAYFKMYKENPEEFPIETRNPEYLDRLKSCYPIHPELFDKLYEQWATLERFQKTRGVLRLMANVISQLWNSEDSSLLIMPGTLSLNVSTVKTELIQYISGENWDSIVDSEIDGPESIPQMLESRQPSLGSNHYVKKTTRTLFLGSAASKGLSNRGIDWSYILLGSMQPGDNISFFRDSLRNLSQKLSYLYETSGRYWFDTRPTLRKQMEQRASMISEEHAFDELEKRISKTSRSSIFAAINVCPGSSLDVMDDEEARLVVIDPRHAYSQNDPNSKANSFVQDIMLKRGDYPRNYKNMLIFVVPDKNEIASSISDVKHYLAWMEIDLDKDKLNLDNSDKKMLSEGIDTTNKIINERINNSYCWCFIPKSDFQGPNREIHPEIRNIQGNENFVSKVEKFLNQEDLLSDQFAPNALLMQLNNYLWKDRDYLQIKDIWKYFCSYCYLPRLKNYSVLQNAIYKGVSNKGFFGIAMGIDGDEYIGLKYGESLFDLDKSYYIVKKEIAEAVLSAAQPEPEPIPEPIPDPEPVPGPFGVPTPGPFGSRYENVKHLSVKKTLDNTKYTKDFNALMENVTNQVKALMGSSYKITVSIDADFQSNTVTTATKRSLEENCKTLKVDDYDFE